MKDVLRIPIELDNIGQEDIMLKVKESRMRQQPKIDSENTK